MCAQTIPQIRLRPLVFLLFWIMALSAEDNNGHGSLERRLSLINNTAHWSSLPYLRWLNGGSDLTTAATDAFTLTATVSSTTVGTEIPSRMDTAIATSSSTTSVTTTTSGTTTTAISVTAPTATTAPTTTTTFPSLEDVYEDINAEKDRLHQTGDDGDFGDHGDVDDGGGGGGGGDVDHKVFSDRTLFEEKPNKLSLFDRIKAVFKPSVRNNVLSHAMQGGLQFREKYGSSNVPTKQSSYGEGLGGYYSGPQYSNYGGEQMIPDGAFAPVYKPPVTLTLTADFIELNCATHGRIQHGIRWVKLVGLNPYGHHLFATVADGDRILFDNYHFSVRTDGKNSRLTIRNPDPKIHYGVYQCQASVAGNPSIIVKEDFVVGKLK